MKWTKFKDEYPDTNIYILYCLKHSMSVEYINEDGMILKEPEDTRVRPNPDAYWAEMPELPQN